MVEPAIQSMAKHLKSLYIKAHINGRRIIGIEKQFCEMHSIISFNKYEYQYYKKGENTIFKQTKPLKVLTLAN